MWTTAFVRKPHVESLTIWEDNMQYNGGKHSCAKQIADLIGKVTGTYWEPFVGAANVIKYVQAEIKIGSDAEECMIALLKQTKEGIPFPKHISEKEYGLEKQRNPSTAYHAFVKYGCSFGGKP